ncbi:MAG: helix-turn-helix transcriptional regulator [Cytophagales bacterium]|nr:helix-turn-helix transcriptional regulator [Cytophagales bacterium]
MSLIFIVDYFPWTNGLHEATLRFVSKAYETLLQTVAANVRAARQAVGLSQEALALDAEVDRTYVSQIERGVCNPSLWVLHKLALILKVEVPSLLGKS